MIIILWAPNNVKLCKACGSFVVYLFLLARPLPHPLEIEDRAACYTFDRTNLWVHRTPNAQFLGYMLLIHSLLCVLYYKYSRPQFSPVPVSSNYLLEIVFRESHKLISESLLIRRTRSSCYPVSLKEKRDKDDYRMYLRTGEVNGFQAPAQHRQRNADGAAFNGSNYRDLWWWTIFDTI